MADVTFGVKVPEEMKNELSELMKTTELSGKEFMGVLLSSYKLEKSKETPHILGEDINELQRLLQRVQNIYINISERAQFVIEEKAAIQQEVIKEKETQLHQNEELIKEWEKRYEEEKSRYQELEKQLKEAGAREEELKKVIEEQKIQIKQSHLLSDKYEEQINRLKDEIIRYERLGIEIEERNEENQKLKNRTDELASEVWFLQRELEKINQEKELLIQKSEESQQQVEKQYQLELKNQLLEQKLVFTNKIELLKEENYKIQQENNIRIQELLAKKTM